ncbi:ivns1abpa [Symbiodinium microadriaticum]|nr:ivns1abpa [Symbiodinium microadriaticum]
MAGFALRRRRLRLRAKARALESKLERSSLSDSHAASYATSLSTASENSDSSLKALLADVEQLREDYGTLCDCLRGKGVLTNEDLVEQGSRRLQAAAFQSLCRSPAAVRVVAEALGPAVAALSAASPCAASACRSTFLMEPAERETPQELAHREDEESPNPARRSATAEALEKVPGTTAVSSKSALSSRLLAHLIGVMWRAEERERPASIALHLKEVVRNLGHFAGATTAFKLSELCRCTADALRPVLPLISKEAPSIYVCGGSCGTAMDSAERFNPRTNQWEMLPSMCMPRRACAAASAGGKFYVLGGVDVPRFGGSEETQQEWMFQDKYCPECFDPVLNQWELLPPMNRPYTHAAATALGGFIYVFGGLSFGHVLDQAAAAAISKDYQGQRDNQPHLTLVSIPPPVSSLPVSQHQHVHQHPRGYQYHGSPSTSAFG